MENSNIWKYILIGSTLGMYAASIALTSVLYAFFAGESCVLNRFFITFNLILCIVITVLCINPTVQEANTRSGLAQSSMVTAYCTYLVTSAVANHDDGKCNPLNAAGTTTKTTTLVIGAVFTFLAIAYSTTRAATQSKALVGKRVPDVPKGYTPIGEENGEVGLVSSQPQRKDDLRTQALMAAVEAGSIPASALDEEDEDEDEGPYGEERDDERTGTKYNYAWFHAIFIMAAMYVGMLLTDWNVVVPVVGGNPDSDDQPVRIGRSHTAMWMRIVSSWICLLIYTWSLVAPVVMPERFDIEQ